jgi:protein-disulfide isomerase
MNETNTDNGTMSNAPRGGSSMAIPVAIVLGFGLIALSIYLSGGKATNLVAGTEDQPEIVADLKNIAPITEADHIRGNPNAPLVIVEYSDFDCPYCQRFHVTMQKVMDEYGPGGQVAWVYRHMPLTSLHPSAGHLAEASECVAELGGDEAFWKFADMIFGERLENEMTNIVLLPEFAVEAGVSETEYKACVASGRHRAAIEADMQNATDIGANGTPYSVVITGDQKMLIEGAQPYANLKLLIDGLLQ